MRGVESIIGTTIAGRYRVVERVGHGGMGAVYAAVQEPLGRRVALKVLKPSFAADDVAVARFKKEAAIVSGLSHPNIVTLFDFGETDDGLLYIVMELLRGETLGRVLKSGGPMPWKRTIPIVEEIVRGLAAAHDVGVIHRDLKLENIMLVQAEGGRDIVKILDFGVAKSVKSEDTFALTATDSSPGTPGYMSPELARGVTTDPRSDFYALGVVWFELLVGHRPYLDKNPMDVFLKQMTQPVPRAASFASDIPGAVDDVLASLLDRDPNGRPRDAAALLDAVLTLEPDSTGRARIVRAPPPKAPAKATTKGTANEPATALDSGMFQPTQFGAPPMTTDATGATDTIMNASVAAAGAPTVSDTFSDTSASEAQTLATTTVHLPVAPTRAPIGIAALVASVIVALVFVALHEGARHDVDDRPVEATVNASAPFRIQFMQPKSDAQPSHTASPTPPPAPAATRTTTATATATTTTTTTTTNADADAVPAAAPVVVERVSGVEPKVVVDADDVRRRLAAVGDRMRDQSLLPDDVRDYRALSAKAKDALDAGHADEAAGDVDALEKELGAIHLTEAFIRAKIGRVEGAVAKDAWQDADVQSLRTEVHEKFGARDLAGANAALNRLWLASLKRRTH